jgi:multicomponent Na+:H+ antiporter subunit D
MGNLLLLPLLIPLFTAALALLSWRRYRVQRSLALVGAVGLLLSALVILMVVWSEGILVVQVGNWPAPFGITFVADLFSAIMTVLGGIIALVVVVYSYASIDARRERFGYYPLILLLMMGISGSFLTGDIFNLYVWFEVMLMASFVLVALGNERAQLAGAFKYVTINLVSSAIFLTAVGILYSISGTLNMAHLAVQLAQSPQPNVVTVVAMLFLVAFGIKAAVFPLFFWLPESYPVAPIAVTALFAGLLTKVGVYALVRVFTLLFTHDVSYTHALLLVLSGFTMVTGVLGAAAQNDIRRILSFHSISQIGYMVMGLALYTPLALAGTVFYIIHHSIVKSNLFLISGIVHRLQGSYHLKYLGGLYRSHFGLAILFLLPAMSLAGIPLLSGFWAKFTLIRAGLETGHAMIVLIALVVSILTLFSMTKIWAEAFWKPADGTAQETKPMPLQSNLQLLLPVVSLVVLTVLIGLLAEPIFTLVLRAANQLLSPTEYVSAVLGGLP